MKPRQRSTIHSFIAILFIISGAVGLIYQIVWFKYLSLFLGNTTYAQTIVLATFMGGLAIGSAWWGKKADISRQPIRLYAFLELGIGIYCLLYPDYLNFLKEAFIAIVVSTQLPTDGTTVLALKLFISICSLLIPTILMGGTLPILVRFISNKMEESGRNIAVLYFLNSFGAVIGSLLAGFFFIRILGLSTTIYSAAITNLLIGGFAFYLSTWKTSPDSNEFIEQQKTELLFSHREIILALIVAGLSGLSAMIYEITWVRLLIPVLGSSIYSFSIMLVAFISGITIGSLIVSSLFKKAANLPKMLLLCQFAIVLSLLATLPLYARIPYEFWKIASLLTHSDAAYPVFLSIQFIFSFSIMIIPTIFLGMSLPIATRIASRSIDIIGRSVGNVFAINTLGTVIGSLLAGLVLIPLVGVKHTIEIGIGINLLAGLIIFIFSGSISRRRFIAVPVCLFIAGMFYLLFVPNWNRHMMLSGVFRRIHFTIKLPDSYSEFVNQNYNSNIFFYKEGTTATVGVIEGKYRNEKQKILIVNGKPDASSKVDLPTQILIGQLPCLIHKDPQNALVIGLGSGVTAGSILTHPVKQLDCVEISPEVIEASSHFDDVNHQPLKDARTKLYVEDALAYLKLTPKTYDIIASEPTNPWIAGVGNLFTQEFFEASKKRMNSGGIMVQWFHLYEMDDELFKIVLQTFKNSFPYVSIWRPLDVDIIIIGSAQPLSIDFERIKSAMANNKVKEDLNRILIPDAATLLSHEMLTSNSIDSYLGVSEINTEDRPRLEYGAPKAFFVNRSVEKLLEYDERLKSGNSFIQLKKLMENRQITDIELRNIGFLHSSPRYGNPVFGYSIVYDLFKRHPKDKMLLDCLATTSERIKRTYDALEYRKMIAEQNPNNPYDLEKYAWLKFTTEHSLVTILTPRDTKESERLLLKSIKLVSDTVDLFRLRLADIYYETQQYAKAMDQYARTIQIRSNYIGDLNIQDDALFLQLARCLNLTGKKDRAIGYALQAVKINPNNQEAKDLIYEIWTKGIKMSKLK